MYRMTLTVLAHGVFDVLHHGHIAFLEKAAKLGDELVVSITADAFVNKGPNRPVFTDNQRAVTLGALESVDRVVISESENAIQVINVIKPDFYVKGLEYSHEDTNGMLQPEIDAVIAHGGMLSILDTPTDSSSRAINIDRPTIPEDAQTWVAEFEYEWKDVKSWLEN
jgi:rfaE bifunctional protein nucleotidyltransferase chain/domain